VYVAGVLLASLRHYITDADVFSRQPADVVARMPCVVVRDYGGQDLHLMLAARPLIQVDSYAETARDASDLADAVVGALNTAWRTGYVTSDGVIAYVNTTSRAAEVREADQPDDLFRWRGTYQLTIRP
jgi:hypothetical protein